MIPVVQAVVCSIHLDNSDGSTGGSVLPSVESVQVLESDGRLTVVLPMMIGIVRTIRILMKKKLLSRESRSEATTSR